MIFEYNWYWHDFLTNTAVVGITEGASGAIGTAFEKVRGCIGVAFSGAYFWNAIWQKNRENIGFNWRKYSNGMFSISAQYGQTTFFNIKTLQEYGLKNNYISINHLIFICFQFGLRSRIFTKSKI